jgi:tetratricopeptide (TPR) repeat protein
MASTLTTSEEAQLAQTIEMFEVITQSQPNDYQSLEILKEAYVKLGRRDDAVRTGKQIAQAYVQMGQFSSAILEYENILERSPDDPDVQRALQEIEQKAGNFPSEGPEAAGLNLRQRTGQTELLTRATASDAPREVEDGRRTMSRIFVEGKLISAELFDQHWKTPELNGTPADVADPFIQVLADRALVPIERSLRLLSDKSRVGFLPLTSYDMDVDLARTFPTAICRRWCIMPFDRMSNSVFVATANPFNQQAAKELAEGCQSRLLWYLVPPAELVKTIRKIYR